MINIKRLYQTLIPFYCRKFKLSNISIKKDNRILASARVKYRKNGGIIIFNNKRLSNDKNYDWGLSTMFHELGHLKYRLSYFTKKQKILSEYKAEIFAIKQMKKYYPKRHKRLIKSMLKNTLSYYKEDFPIHYEAFLKIREYQIKEKND